MVRPVSSRARPRRVAPVELAVGFALVGSLLGVAVPTFLREVHSSRLVEPVRGLERIGASAVAYARTAHDGPPFPASAPLTPPSPPRGRCEADPPGTWEQPTWTALAFRPAPEGAPHCFAFAFESSTGAGEQTFRAQAHGDLDGDGIPSTFEITGRAPDVDPRAARVDPGMFVDKEVE
jgi:hypothetical protein